MEYIFIFYRVYFIYRIFAKFDVYNKQESLVNILEPDKNYNLTVGLRIREIREAHNLTRAEFSEKCNISDSFLAAVESGKKSITSKTLYKICTAMNISADYFIRGKQGSFESDMIMELIDSMDKLPREAILRMLREYVSVIHQLTTPKE